MNQCQEKQKFLKLFKTENNEKLLCVKVVLLIVCILNNLQAKCMFGILT